MRQYAKLTLAPPSINRSNNFMFAKTKSLILLLLTIFFTQLSTGQSTDRLRVLFLGDNGHHEPAKRMLQIYPFMAERGIQLVYTDDASELNPENLAQYHALMFFGNTPHISPSEETALLDFVANGKGLVTLHAGVAMFANSDAYTNLVGGTFKSHGVGTFTVNHVRPNHPAIKGVAPFTSWDESYIHMRHNPDKTILAFHEEDGRREPWTWVRNHGEGRVFYTAWGHDERTWSKEGFHQLVERGLRWAVGDWALDADWAPAALTYEEDGKMPYYPAGEGWGVTGEPFTEAQTPLSPAASIEQAFVEPGFHMELYAAEPEIINPIDMTWDERGRLWVVETIDYPNEFKPERKGLDRIKILEDTDGDGRADKSTIFAEGLNIPTSLVLSNGGVIVAQAPDMLFLKDTDGDDRADVHEVLFSGWGTNDTHAGPNNLRYGLDNQIWGAVGYSAFRGSLNGKDSLRFGQAIFRFDTDASKIEHMATFNNNTWGLSFSEDGFVFGSTANGNPSMHSAIPERYYKRLKTDAKSHVLNTIADDASFFPIAPKVRQVDWHGKYTAGSGYEIYSARSFPKEYWNRVGFIGGPTGHLLGKFIHEPAGSGFTAMNDWNMVASRDEWFSPIQIRVGPDGALWVIDWYNLIIQHNPQPPGFELGEGNAYENELRDKQHSRIYRIVHKDMPATNEMNLANASAQALVDALQSDNMFWRTMGQRLLVERGNTDVLPQLYNLIEDERVDEIGLNPAAIHALWTLHGLGALDGSNTKALSVATHALHHPSSGVQRAALMTLPRTYELLDAMLQAGMLPDPAVPEGMSYTVPTSMMDAAKAQTRLAAVLAVADIPYSEHAGKAVADLIGVPDNVNDEGIRTAAMAAGIQHGQAFLSHAMKLESSSDTTYTKNLQEVLSTVSGQLAASGTSEDLGDLLQSLEGADPKIAGAMLDGMAANWPQDLQPVFEAMEQSRMTEFYERLATISTAFGAIVERWESSE
ncbi:MAG: PVC-type heme-binding CxxCH protein [Rhodothermales bacterium]